MGIFNNLFRDIILTAIGGLIGFLGSFLSIKYQDKKKINTKVYQPLLKESDVIILKIRSFEVDTSFSEWEKIKERYEHYYIPLIARRKLIFLYNICFGLLGKHQKQIYQIKSAQKESLQKLFCDLNDTELNNLSSWVYGSYVLHFRKKDFSTPGTYREQFLELKEKNKKLNKYNEIHDVFIKIKYIETIQNSYSELFKINKSLMNNLNQIGEVLEKQFKKKLHLFV